MMQAKNVLYAAVGAPVVAARKVSGTVGGFKTRLSEEANDYGKAAEKAVEAWAAEGEKFVSRVADNEKVEELAAKVDLDQAKEQVGKLRTQLEDMLETWRASFRPEKAATAEKVEVTATKPAPKTSAKTTAKKPAAKKPAAKTTAKKPAAKTSTAKTTSSSSKASTAKAPSASAAKSS